MADVFAPQPVKTKTNGDIVAAIVDSAGSNKAAVSAAGAVKVDNSAVSQPVIGTGTAGSPAGNILTVQGVASMTKLLVTPDSVALPANQSVNAAQVGGTATDTNSGTKSAGTLRVVLATDQPQLTNKLLVTPDSVALPANQSVNVNQIGGSAVSTGNGTTGAGSQRVTIASDNSAIPVTAGLTGTTQDSGHLTSAAVAAGATVTLDSTQIASGTGKVYEATVSSSVALKAQLGTWDGTTFVVFRTFFVAANTNLIYVPARYDAITKATGATAKFRWSITNNDNANAADVYASITYAN